MTRKKQNSFIRKLSMFLALIIFIAVSMNITACSTLTQPKIAVKNLMKDIDANITQGKIIDDHFIDSASNFTVELFKKSIDQKKNTLVSPISVMFALSMTANGAGGETLSQIEKILGGDISLEDLNEYLHYYSNSLPNEEKSKLKIANSIWFRDDEDRLTIEKDFLQKNADYYDAEIYKSPFTDQTILDINNWVKQNTEGMIDKIIDEIEYDTIMYLINAIVFDAEWKTVYNKSDIYQEEFTNLNGIKQKIEFMRSDEYLYLDDENATGFIKPYYDDKYSFVALLPNEEVTLENYISTLTGKGLLNIINSAKETTVVASTPKFSYEYEIELNDILKALGMPDGFDPDKANFLRMGRSTRGNIYIGDVLHKTFISLDELGTKAGAVTKVEMKDECAAMDTKIITLDRPFVYAIVDNSTNLPVFIGTVVNLEG